MKRVLLLGNPNRMGRRGQEMTGLTAESGLIHRRAACARPEGSCALEEGVVCMPEKYIM